MSDTTFGSEDFGDDGYFGWDDGAVPLDQGRGCAPTGTADTPLTTTAPFGDCPTEEC